MGHVVAGHRGDGENGDRSGGVEVDRLFVTRGKLAVEVAGITAVRRNLFHRDGDFLQRVGEGGHIGQQYQHPFVLQRELFGHGEGKVGHHQAFDDRVGRGVNEQHRARQGALAFQRVAEEQVVVVFQPHAAEHDDIDFGLHRDAGEQRVVGFAGDGEDREFL